MSGEAMFPHVDVTTSLMRLREAIAAQSRWMEEHGSLVPDGEMELLAARRVLADELLEEARMLNVGREDQQAQWTDYAESRKSETEIVIIGIQATMDEYELAGILGGGMKIRKVTMAGTETFVAYHHANDATEAMETATAAILNAVNQETVVKRARYKHAIHKHEEDPDGPQPEYVPYPTQISEKSGRWTKWGNGDDDEEEASTGGWTDWSKGERQWVTQQNTRRLDRTNTTTGATSSRTSTEEVSGWADPDEERSRKRPRGL
jgi:hypothetical protein